MNEHCAECPLECNPVSYRGDIEAPIVVVGAAPSLEEVENNTSVGGASGRYMLDVLQREGFELNDILFVNSIMCHSPDPDLITLKTLQCCQANVDEIISAHPRKLIIAMGNEAWSSIHNLRKIGGVRVGCGKVIHCNKFDCWSVWNINPLFAMRSPNWKPEFEQAIRRAYQTYTVGTPQRPPVTILEYPTTVVQAIEYIKQAAQCEAVSFDIETGNPAGTDPNYQTHPILGIGFGWSDPVSFNKTAFYLPILHGAHYEPSWSFEDWIMIDSALRQYIFNGATKLIAQNGKFDARFLWFQYGYDCTIWFDTIVAHRLIDENKAHGLKSIARFWLNTPDWDVWDTLEKGQHLGVLPLDIVAEYCAFDAAYTYELCELFQDMMEGQSFEKTFWELDQPLFNTLIDVEMEGMKVDTEVQAMIAEALLDEIQAAKQECNELSGWANKVLPHKDKRKKDGGYRAGVVPGINPGSSADVGFILYTHFKLALPPLTQAKNGKTFEIKKNKKLYYTKAKKPKVDKIAIEYLLNQMQLVVNDDGEVVEEFYVPFGSTARKFIHAYQHYNSLATLYGNVIKGVRENTYPDGRVHTNYGFSMRDDNNSPVTGRLSSNSPNMQNMKAAFKPIFLSPYDGWKIIEFDYSQSEVRCAAYMSGDPVLRDALYSGDLHRTTAAGAFNKKPEDVTHEERQAAKTLIFGNFLFAGGFDVITRAIHCSLEEAKRLDAGLKATYSVCNAWMEQQVATCRDRGYVETIFGRQRRLPEIWGNDDSAVSSAERQAKNSPVQGSSAELTNLAIVRIAKYLCENNYQARIINTVHDSIVVSCPPEEAEEVAEVCASIMTQPPFPEFDIDLDVEYEIKSRWGGELNINAIKGLKENTEEILDEPLDINTEEM